MGGLRLKTQLLCGDEIAFGPGKADLLDAIDREGSISAAGRALGMSYRRTWQLVDVMNRCWHGKLVEALHGGGRERGARVTPLGHRILSTYRNMEARLLEASAAAMDDLLAELREAPLAAKADDHTPSKATTSGGH